MQSESFEIKRPWCNQDSTKKVSRFFTLATSFKFFYSFKLAIKMLKTCNCKIVVAV